MKDNLMQKMFGVFESIIKSEGATALTNERIKKCCEENGVDYEEFSASVIEEVLSVIGAHSGTSGDVLLSELSSRDLEAVSGGMGTFRRGTASALAALSLCGATQLPASAVKHTNRQVVNEKVASRHLKKRSGDESIITSQAAQTLAKYLSTAALGSFLTYLLMSRINGEAATPTPAPDQPTDLGHTLTTPVKISSTECNGFLPESTHSPAEACVKNSEGKIIVTPQSDGSLFRKKVLFDTLRYCQNTFKFSVTKHGENEYNATDVWRLPADQPQPVVINEEVKSVRVTKLLDPDKCATISLTNGRCLQSMICMSQIKGRAFNMFKSAVLDCANFFDPGGKPFDGCRAQEESITRITNLFPLLCNNSVKQKFYDQHNKLSDQYVSLTGLTYWESIGTFRDCIYVPGVKQIKNDYGASRIGGFIDGPIFNIIAAAAPDLRTVPVDETHPDYRDCFKKLWRQIISTACTQGNENLIAGALGCGAFKNDPQVVAETFFDVLMNEGPNENTRWAEMLKNVVLSTYVHQRMAKDIANYYCFLVEAMKYADKGLKVECYALTCPE